MGILGYLFLWRCSMSTQARMGIVCENHKINKSTLIKAILETISDEELLRAVKTVSKVLSEEEV